jgi:hypothetical protein
MSQDGPSRKPWSPPEQPLEAEKSAVLREKLLGEVGALATQEQVTAWRSPPNRRCHECQSEGGRRF